MSPRKLKKELEELIIFNVEQDVIDFPFNKAEFAPYVVVAYSKGLSRDEIVPDVFKQLERAIEHEKMLVPVVERKSWISKFKFW